jgi:hypothetical protein
MSKQTVSFLFHLHSVFLWYFRILTLLRINDQMRKKKGGSGDEPSSAEMNDLNSMLAVSINPKP